MNQSKLQALLEKQITQGSVRNIAVGIRSEDGRIDLTAAAGIADPASGAPMTAGTPYFIASISKMFTAAMIFKLHEQGRLGLDEPITRYLPAALLEGIHVYQGRDYGAQIQVHHLLSHTSGLADYFEGKPQGGASLFDELKQGRDRAVDLPQILGIVRGLSPAFPPGAGDGSKARYSDTNFQLLGAIIEAVTDQPIAAVLEAMITAPLGLADTYAFDAALADSRPAPATIYFGDRAAHVPQFMTSTTADGGVVSTVADNLAFLRAFFAGDLFDAALLERAMARWNRIFFPMQYGYGLMRIKLPRLFSPFKPIPAFVGHSGSTGSFAYFSPEKRLYLAGTLNQTDSPGRPVRLMVRLASAVG